MSTSWIFVFPPPPPPPPPPHVLYAHTRAHQLLMRKDAIYISPFPTHSHTHTAPPSPPTNLTATFLSECSVLASLILPGPSPVDSDAASADIAIIEHLRTGDSRWDESARVLATNTSGLLRLPGGTQGTLNASYQLRVVAGATCLVKEIWPLTLPTSSRCTEKVC